MPHRHQWFARAWLLGPLALLVAGCSALGLGAPSPTPTLEPSATPPPPSATPEPSPTPDYVYQDTFADPASGWPTVTTETTKAGYHPPEAYHLEVSTADTAVWITRQEEFGDFSVELEVYTENASDSGEWRHGLVFRSIADDQFYAFVINPRAQAWAALKYAAPPTAIAARLARPAWQVSEWQTLADGANDSITAEAKAINVLRVDAQGPNLTFSVNGQGLVALSDPDFASGDFGFVLQTHEAALAHIHFEQITVRAFDPAAVPAAPVLAAIPSETPTATPTATRAPGQPEPTFDATAFVGTAQALGTTIPPGATLACGFPGVPCPQTIIPPEVGTFVPPALPDIVGSVVP